MANEEHLAILKQGVEAWNKWRKETLGIQRDLRDAGIFGTDLSGADLSGVDFSGAKLRGAKFIEADLSGAKFIEADLSGADLSEADLSRARLGKANLRGAKLTRANFSMADLQDANFAQAGLFKTIFTDTDLSVAKGLDTLRHEGPSTIGIDTLYKSSGQIPVSFLRGCGLSDWEIESAKLYNPDLSNEEINDIQYRVYDLRARRAFQINPLFISYSHSDSSFVDEIEKQLIQQGIRFWRDKHHATAGRLETQIDRAIMLKNDVVLLVLSEYSTNSDWVEHEARKAREKERQTGKDALCPVALDDSWKTCLWPERLREQIMEYNILDFSNWQDESYFQKMFGKLLEGLNLFYK